MARPSDVARGVVLDGRYRIDEIIGQGGMATVYRAHDEVLGRDVAVKLFPPTPDGDEVLRHKSEMRVLARMSHPGLVTLHDAGSAHAGGPLQQTYLVMELVAGPTLADLLAGGPLSSVHTARIGRQLAEALATVHVQDVVHRDIKPANVLLVDSEALAEDEKAALTTGPIVKLADFGIARFSDSARLTMTGTTLGTATYLSPEQAAGGAVGPPTDVYALGLVLLECLTGRKAFTGTVVEVAAARLNTEPEVPTELGPEWIDLLGRMTRRDPAERVPMAEAAVLLARIAGEPTGEIPQLRVSDVPTAATQTLAPADLPRPGVPGPRAGSGPVPVTVPPDDTHAATHTRPLALGDVRSAATGHPAASHGGQPSDAGARSFPAPGQVQEVDRGQDPDHHADDAASDDDARSPRAVAASRSAHDRVLWALVAAAALLVAVVLVVLTRPDAPEAVAPPSYPEVEGTLGEAIDRLIESVEP